MDDRRETIPQCLSYIPSVYEWDTINVGAGTYTEPVTIIGKSVIFQGAGKDVTIINVAV